jgi:hypothetical protein
MRKLSFFSIFIVFLFISCNNRRQKEEQQADKMLSEITQLISANKYSSAKTEIDSLHKTFPRLVAKRKIAAAYADTIVRRESGRTLDYCNKILPEKLKQLEALKKDFRFEKDAKYQEVGSYIYKTQTTDKTINRNLLRCYTDENADFFLESCYTGSKINHYAVKVSVNELSARTDTQKRNGVFHNFDDGANYFETLTFHNEDENGIAAFIATQPKAVIKVTLIGSKNYSYTLSDQDKKAIEVTYRFRTLLNDTKKLQQEIMKATIKIGNIKLRYEK